MPRVRHVRSFLCLLLAVSTAVGTVASSVRACACGPRQQKVASPEVAATSEPVQSEPAVRHCCCPPESVQAACCCRTESSAPSPESTSSGCECAACGCENPTAPPTAPAPTSPADANPAVHADAAALMPPAFLPLPSAVRTVPVAFNLHHPPDDLVVTLSRLTC